MILDRIAKSKKKKKTKTFTGCATCRSRKIKCDLGKPYCNRCVKSGLICAGYQIVLCWSRPIKFDKYGYQIRTSIFPEEEQESPNKGFQRRNIEFVRYDREYETYDEMDRDLGLLHSPDYAFIEESQTWFQGPFGVFEGLINIPTHIMRKRRKLAKSKYATQLRIDNNYRVFSDESRSNSGRTNDINTPLEFDPNNTTTPSSNTMSWHPGNIFEEQSKINHEWLSNELRFDALLSATAATSSDQNNIFMDFLYPYNNNINTQQSPLNLNELSQRSDELFPYDREVFNALKPHNKYIQPQSSQLQQPHTQPQDTINELTVSDVLVSDPFQLTKKHGINDDHESDTIEKNQIIIETNESHMPENVMKIIKTPIFPELSPSLQIPKMGLQINSLTRFLLANYYEKVADLMTVVPFTSNPWKTIYYPRAVKALGDIGATGKTSDSGQSLLNALFAVSCFCLQSQFEKGSTEMKFFLNLGIEFRLQASSFLKKLLSSDDYLERKFQTKEEKYKDVVVAVLSMNTIDVVWGTMADCQYYLGLCEEIIAKRMVKRPNLSNKARILHRIFSFLKLLQDSTNFTNLNKINNDTKSEFFTRLSKARNNGLETTEFYENVSKDGQIEIGFTNKKGDNDEQESVSPSLCSVKYAPEFIDQDTWKTKNNKDVLLTDALYGLPNSLILLFSETVKLLKIKLFIEKENSDNDTVDEDFSKYNEVCQCFENRLLNWQSEWLLRKDSSEDGEEGEFLSKLHESIYHHSISFYNGLIIYFYSMIKKSPLKFLQKYSIECITHLEILQKINLDEKLPVAPLIWQGIISGCVAINGNLQKRYKDWASLLAERGVGSYWGARQMMFEVWRRRQNNEANDDWLSVHRDWEMNIMLC